MPKWKRIQDEGAGYIYVLNESLSLMDWRYPSMLEAVSDGVMVIASDYSGQHQGAANEAYSFVITTDRTLAEWEPTRRAFRSRWLRDGRRMSFKKLNEPVRRRALIPFLDAVSEIRGNVITVLVDRRVGSFLDGGTNAIAEVFPDCFPPGTRSGTTEKMFRLASLLAMLIAGLRREDQRSLWVSDHDETLETFERREQFARLTRYLSVGLTKWRNPADNEFGTTEHPSAPGWAEDLCAVPDIFAGAFCQLSEVMPAFYGNELWTRVISPSNTVDHRASAVANWLAMTACPLRHVLLRLAPDNAGIIRSSTQFFAGALDSRGSTKM